VGVIFLAFYIKNETLYNDGMTIESIYKQAIKNVVVKFYDIVWDKKDKKLPKQVSIEVEDLSIPHSGTMDEFESNFFYYLGERLADIYPGYVCEDFKYKICFSANVKESNEITITQA
jgi:hypothetical protein